MDMDASAHTLHQGECLEANTICADLRHNDQNRIIVLYKNLIRYNNFMKTSNLEDTCLLSTRPTTPVIVSETWSVYKQFIPVLRPRKLSCMASANDMVATRTLDTKAKLREMHQLEEDIQKFIANETPYERFRRTYTFDVNTGQPTVQQQRFILLAKLVFSGLFCIGGYKGFLAGREDYLQKSKLVMFASKGAAHKKRYNHQMRFILKHGIKFSFKAGMLFCSIFALYQGIEIYMNKSTPWSLAVAFGVGTGLAKISLGPKGMLANGIIASVLGLFGGLISWSGVKMAGETQEELNYQAVKAKFLIRRQFQRTESRPVIEYHEEVDEID